MRVAIVSDAWTPQTNGVVTTLRATAATLERRGYESRVIALGEGVPSFPCPSYPEIRLAIAPGSYVARELDGFGPHAIHIATEGPIGLAARRYCIERRLPFTTSYHTRYPEYLRARWPIPLAVTYAWLRRFHGAAARTFVGSESLRAGLGAQGFANLHIWRRGVDLTRFAPHTAAPPDLEGRERPVLAYAGRVAVEKNLEAFLGLDVPGTKLVIGGGPQLEKLQARYPHVIFAGFRFGEELVRWLAAADAFVFPSLTDTFGIAMIEAIACGVPVAAFPVPGPLDVIEPGVTGVLHQDLAEAIRGALRLDRGLCAERAASFTWDAATDQFLAGIAPFPARAAGRKLKSRLLLGAARGA
jgi:glycosyltransferase involved in cell wall biosynthesis